jgi:cytoskeletal protein CcmA (bactofilin family)
MWSTLSIALLLTPSGASAQEPPAPPTVEVEVPIPPPPADAVPATPDAPSERPPTRFQSDQEAIFDLPTRDAFGMGQLVRVSTPIDDNAFLMGQNVEVNAPIGGDLFALGQTLTINAPIAGDVYAAGQNVVVTDQGSIAGDLLGGGEHLEISGPVGGDVQVGAETLKLSGPVTGFVEATFANLELGDGASVGGDFDYTSVHPVQGLDGIVRGTARFTEAEEEDLTIEFEEEPPSFASSAGWWMAWTTWSYVAKLLLGSLFLLLGGGAAARVARAVTDEPAQSFGWGFVVACALFIGSIIALVLIVPFPLGVIGLMSFFFLLYAAQIISAQAIGAWALRRFRPDGEPSPFAALALGLVPVVLLGAIPWFGGLVWLAATIAGIGALWISTRANPIVA